MATEATWNGKVIASSADVVMVEGNAYFPLEAVNREFIKDSTHSSVCSWKGTAHYYDVVVDGQTNANAAWYYANPKTAAAEIKGRVAFWKGVKVQKSSSL